ncbi:MAG: family phosphatase [Propionibacteriaceae bacterium]|nr:family phosphatase [Propionibacteriaceae bacterium]
MIFSEPSWQPRLVALDIDGTIVDLDGAMPEAVRKAVGMVLDAGVPVVLATGRSWHGTRPVFDELGLPPGPSVCSNGAVVVSYPPQQIHKAVTFDPRQVIKKVVEFAPGTLIAVEEIGRGYRLNDHFPGGDLTGEMIIESIEQLSSRPVTRIILRDPSASEEDFTKLARHLGLKGVSYFVGWSAWLDIAPLGVNKASALQEVADDLGVDAADVLAFGDGRNDIEMLHWAGRGVAVGDAPEEVQQVADVVTDTFADGGPVAELLHWFD